MDKLDILCGLLLIVNMVCFVPWTLHTLERYKKLSGNREKGYKRHFKMRGLELVYGINILCIIMIVIERPFFSFYFIFTYSNNLSSNQWIPHWVFELVHSMTWFAILFTLCIKFYLLYYAQQFSQSVLNMTWQKQINIGVTGM